jgi:hypothetical protein
LFACLPLVAVAVAVVEQPLRLAFPTQVVGAVVPHSWQIRHFWHPVCQAPRLSPSEPVVPVALQMPPATMAARQPSALIRQLMVVGVVRLVSPMRTLVVVEELVREPVVVKPLDLLVDLVVPLVESLDLQEVKARRLVHQVSDQDRVVAPTVA